MDKESRGVTYVALQVDDHGTVDDGMEMKGGDTTNLNHGIDFGVENLVSVSTTEFSLL